MEAYFLRLSHGLRVTLPTTEPSSRNKTRGRKLLSCAHCGCDLFAADFIGQSAAKLTRALQFHHSGACKAWTPELSSDIYWPDFEPPLVACARAKKAALAIEHLKAGASPDASGRHGIRALHAAAVADDVALVSSLLEAGASPLAVTRDDANANVPGGRTPLHAAAAAGSTAAARALVAAAKWVSRLCDNDSQIPAEVAWLSGHQELAIELADAADAAKPPPNAMLLSQLADEEAIATTVQQIRSGPACPSDRSYALMVRKVELRERRRDALRLDERPLLRTVHILRKAWSAEQCDELLRDAKETARLHGWSTGRHKHHPTTDLALWRAPIAAKWVRASLDATVFPAMGLAYGVEPSRLSLREAFIACYQSSGGNDAADLQAGLGMHKDGTLFSCACLLNNRNEFEGGGTCFAQPVRMRSWEDGEWRESDWAYVVDAPSKLKEDGEDEEEGEYVVDANRGDVVLMSGQMMHGARPVASGVRYLLVCFIDEIPEEEAMAAAPTEAAQLVEVPKLKPLRSVSLPAPDSPTWVPSPSPAKRGWRNLNTMRRMSCGLAAEDPGSRKRLVGFAIDESATPAPERKGRFSMPGGKQAFKGPIWRCDDEEVEPAAPVWTVSLSIDGTVLFEHSPIDFSAAGEACVRLTAGAPLNLRDSVIVCDVREGNEEPAAAHVEVEPPTPLDEWVAMPGSKRPTASYCYDVPGFTICFDAATSENGDAGHGFGARAELRVVRILRHKK